jgi:formylglycine-generating enzyme required for sulfatase activity
MLRRNRTAGFARTTLAVAIHVTAICVTAAGWAHRPPPDEDWWRGLDEPATAAATRATVVLRARIRGRVRISGGTFVMGASPAEMVSAIDLCRAEIRGSECGEGESIGRLHSEGATHVVTVSTFELDRTEVTVADYSRCVAAGECEPADFSRVDPRFARPELPVSHVGWEDGARYCRWAGGRLPTEAEWEYAARGADQREFPWGNLYNPHLANHGAWADDPADATDGFVYLAPVGSFTDGATPLGIQDMAGNVAEWVADEVEADSFGRPSAYEPSTQPQVDPRTNASAGIHVLRGGSFMDPAVWLRASARDTTALPRPSWAGFRCAADPH